MGDRPWEWSSLLIYNYKYIFLLNFIEIFSRYAWSVPLKDRTGNSVAAALTTLFQNRKPITIQSDKGTEFLNAKIQQYLKRQKVGFHTTHNPDVKGVVIERFICTLMTKMYKHFTKNNKYRNLTL